MIESIFYRRPEDLESDLERLSQTLSGAAQLFAEVATPLANSLLKRTVDATVGAEVHRSVLRWGQELRAMKMAVDRAREQIEDT